MHAYLGVLQAAQRIFQGQWHPGGGRREHVVSTGPVAAIEVMLRGLGLWGSGVVVVVGVSQTGPKWFSCPVRLSSTSHL